MNHQSGLAAAYGLFLGHAPGWYKNTILAFLAVNPVVLAVAGPFACGWLILLEFIFALALALKCYPLQPGGLLALEAIALKLATPDQVYQETAANFPVILLLIFMVAGIYFLREMIVHFFTRLFIRVTSKTLLSFLFCFSAAALSAFLDALTVVAMVVVVATGLYDLHHRYASSHTAGVNDADDFRRFQGFLRSLVMHAAVGTALGGVATLVGEPQNLLIAKVAGWDFGTFFMKVAPISMPVLAAGLVTCVLLEQIRKFGYGDKLPDSIRRIIVDDVEAAARQPDPQKTLRLWIQGGTAALLVIGLGFHLAEVGLIGLTVIVLATAFCGVIEEKRLGHAFEEVMPFTALLVIFFAIVAVIHAQELFHPVIAAVLAQEGRTQLVWMYLANGLLSSISDNVFVGTVYITEIKKALDAGVLDRAQFDLLAVAVNTGTNIPSIATPNGQAAFLFLLTSGLARLIHLGYLRMLWMALPYTIVMTLTGLAAVYALL